MADTPKPVELEAKAPIPALLDAEQLELIRDQVPGRDAETAVAIARQAPRRGRPPGALNKRNARIRDFILSRYGHPLIELAETYSRPVEALAAELQCSLAEARKMQLQAAAELAPYIESKMPVAIAARVQHDVVLLMPGAPTLEAGELVRIAEQVNAAEDPIDWEGAELEDLGEDDAGGTDAGG